MKSFLLISLLVLIHQVACDKLIKNHVNDTKAIEDDDKLFQSGFVKDLDEMHNLMNSTNGRIAGGQTAPRTKFKEYVRLRRFISGREVFGAGSLISSTWVLTAAHCVFR